MTVYVGPARLFGYVRHATFGPIEGASVQIGVMNVVIDALGYYEYPNLQQTSCDMTVTKDGYRQFSGSVHPTSENFQFDVSVKKLATVTLWPNADASVYGGNPDTNNGNTSKLDLFNNGVAAHERFYIRFSLDGIEETAEPSSAILRLYHTEEEGDEASRTLLVARVRESWSESNVTWNNGPLTADPSSVQGVYEQRWYEADVESYFSEWLVYNHDNFGLLVDTPGDLASGRFIFASMEYGEEDKWPHVVLHYAW